MPEFSAQAGGSTSAEGARKTFRRRTRAATACIRCHHRKVRCDLTLRQPCTNCLLDGEDCSARERRRRGPSPLYGRPPQADAEVLDWEAPLHPLDSHLVQDESTEEASPASETQATGPTFRASRRQDVQIEEPSLPKRQSPAVNAQSDIIYSAYSFVNVNGLSKLPQEDIQYLELKSSLRLPTRPYLDEFIRQYFRYVHPCLPVLNEAEFWELYHADERSGSPIRPMSLFVLQSMLYLSSAFVSPETIREAGYQYVKHARRVFYTRAKILHDLSAEQSPLSRAIGALMLTHRFNQDDRQAGSIWLGIAIQNARASHDGSWGTGPFPGQGPLKRLWSCIHLRDRIISMGLRRPMQLPSVDDIEANALTDEDFEDETHHSRVYDAATKRRLSRILVQQYRLAILMGEVMHITQHQSARPDLLALSAAPGKTKPRLPALQERLRLWHEEASASFEGPAQASKPHLSAVMFSSITMIYYHATNISLATYELRQLTKEQSLVNNPTLRAEKRLEQIRQKLKLACSQTERLAMLFVNHGVVGCLPMTVLSYLAFPLLLRVLETNAAPGGQDRITERPVYCAQVIKQCDTRYEGGDHVLSLIRQATASMSEYRQLSVTGKPTTSGSGGFNNKRARSEGGDDPQQRTVSTAWERLLLMKPALFGQISDSFYDAMSRGKGINTDNFPSLLEASLSAGVDSDKTRQNDVDEPTDPTQETRPLEEEGAAVHDGSKRQRTTTDRQDEWVGNALNEPDLSQCRMFDLGSEMAEPDLEFYELPDMVANWWEAEQSWAEDLFEDVSQIPA